jgi:hypothetical protein
MSYTLGDGLVALALAGGIVGCLQVVHQSRRRRLEIVHQERLVAMDKGIPLPELPLDPAQSTDPDPGHVIPILGTVLLSLSLGTMVVLFLLGRNFWVAPLPFAFLGAGLLALHFLRGAHER